MFEPVLQCPPFPKIFVKCTTRQQHPLSARRYSIEFRVSVTSCPAVMFVQSGLNISDGASPYTQNIMNVREVYDRDSMALPTKTFPDSILISFMLKVKVKCTLVQALRLCTGRTAHRGSRGIALLLGKSKVHPCTGTECLYRPYGP